VTTWQALTLTWEWDPSIVLGCAALAGGYLKITRSHSVWRIACFLAGVVVLLLALVSPLDTIGEVYLFSFHMVSHLLLILVVPPLLLLGLPPADVCRLLRLPRIQRIERVLARPLVAWLTGIVTIWVWHLPALYNLTLGGGIHEYIHIVEHLTFLVSATIFWWPVLGPPPRRLDPGTAVAYLLAAAATNTLLGMILAFSPPLYSAYLNPDDEFGILQLVRTGWGLTPERDQQMAGIIMWVPSGVIYFLGVIAVVVRGSRTEQEAVLPRSPMDEAVEKTT
jgi:cytochrome c oxidase assembly factor CtaG